MAVLRRRVVSVRLTDAEWSAWKAAAGRSPFGTTAGWCRAAVSDAVAAYPVGSRLWAQARVIPELSQYAVSSMLHACELLNSVAMRSNKLGSLLLGETSAILLLLDEAIELLPQLEPVEVEVSEKLREISRDELRPHLVNVRVSPEELEEWCRQAGGDGYARVSAWVRALVGSLLRFQVPAEPVEVSDSIVVTRRYLAGAIANLSQLRNLAEASGDDGMVRRLANDQERVQQVLPGLFGPGRRQR